MTVSLKANPPERLPPTGSNKSADLGDRQKQSNKAANGKQVFRRAPTEMLAAALCYAELFGWESFPAPPGAKRSYESGNGKNGNGRRWNATNDPSVIKRYFRQWPKANLGIPTGSENGFWVLEADTPKGHNVDGIASLRRLERKHGRLPKTLMAISPSGSLHYYFKWPKRGLVRNSASVVAPGVDARGAAGMVLAPPSVKKGVGCYRFLNWGTPLADAPQWLLELVVRSSTADGEVKPFNGIPEVDEDELADIMAFVPNDDFGWEEWNEHIMAIFVASGGSDWGFKFADAFSQLSCKYDQHRTRERWEKIKGCPPNRTGVGKLRKIANAWRAVYHAKQAEASSFRRQS